MTGAVVSPDGVPTHVLAAAIARGTLVLVGEEDGGKPVLLHGVVRQELQPETVPLRGDHLIKQKKCINVIFYKQPV